MSALGSLVVKLGLDYAQYTGGLDKSEQAALAASKKIQDTFDGMKAKVAATAGAIAGGLAAGFTIAAFKNIIGGAIETGAALDDLRMQTGASVEALSGLMAIGKFNNMGPEQIGGAMTKLASNLAGATEESKGTGKAIEALGLDFEKFKQLRPEDQMQTVAKAMAKFEDGTGKSAVAMALYGKQGAAMLPFLHDLAEVGDLQAKVTTEQAAAAANLDDNLTRLSTSGEGWKKELANGMIPALDLGAQALVDMMNGSGGLRDEVKKLSADGSIKQWTSDAIKGLSYVADVGQIAWRVLQSIGKGMGGFAAALVQALGGDFRGAWASLQESGKDMIDVFDGPTVGARFRDSMDKVSASAAAAGAAGSDAGKKLDFTNVLAKNTKAATEAKDPFDALRDSIVKTTAAYQAEATAGEKLTEGQKKAIDVLDQIRTGKVKVTEAQAIQIGKDIEAMLVAEDENKAREEFIKSADAERAVRLKMVQGMEQAAVSLEASNQSMREEIELIGLTDQQQVRVLQQRNDAIILTKEATLAELERASAITGTGTREQIALQAEIEALRERNKLLGAKFDKTVVAKAAEQAASEWTKFTDSVYNGLSDSLYRGFEAGKGFFKSFWDGIRNLFKTTVLKFGVQGVMTGVSGFLGFGQAANAATSGSSALSTAGSIGSGYSALAGIGGAFGGGLSGGFGGLMGSLGLSATGSTLGGALSAGGIALQSGNILGGLGTLVGALGPIALGIGALAAIFGKDDSGTYHTGGAGSYSAAGGASTGAKVLDQGLTFGVRYSDYNSQAESAAVGISQSIVGMLDATAKSFGNQAGYFAATAFADDSSKDGAWGSLIIKRLDDTVTNWADTQTSKWAPKVFSDGEAGQKEYSAALALSVRDALVGAVEGVDWAQGLLKGLGSAPTLEGLQGVVETINAAKAAFVGFGQYMPAFTELTNSAVSKMADASGGVGALAGNMGAFVDGFYRDSEKLAINTDNVRDALAKLGFEMPATRDEFKALVQSQIALGDAGAQTTAGLLAVSGAVSAVLPPFEDAAAGVETAIDAVSDAMRRLQSDTTSLEVQLLRAKGDTTGADAAQYTIDTAGLTAAEIAVFDYNASLRAQISALDAATAAAQQQADIREGFERQLLELNGDTAALRLLDIAGMDAANVALYDRVQALTAEKQAEQEAAQAAQQQANTRAGFERQLLQLSGDTAALRLLDIQGMDAANVALYDRVQALTVEKQAEQEAAQAAAQTAQQRYGLEGQLLQLQGNTVALRARELAALDPANRALQQQVWTLTDVQAAAQAAERAEQDLAATRSRVAQERYGLETQLLTLQGNTVALQQRELDLLDPSNRALQQQIWALEGQAQAAQAASSAAQQAQSAWKSLTDSVVDEVRRIRGEMSGGGLQGLAAAQMSFTVANARAAAGDQTAWEQLPQASRALLDVAEATAGSLLDLRRIQAATAASMESTLGKRGIKVPAFASGGDHAGGWAIVGEQGPELAYLPPARIYTASQTTAMVGGSGAGSGNAELLTEVRQLNERMARMERHAERTSISSQLSARVLDDASTGKQPIATETTA